MRTFLPMQTPILTPASFKNVRQAVPRLIAAIARQGAMGVDPSHLISQFHLERAVA